MSIFRPCIDLHNGQVKQIVGGTLDTADLTTNFISEHPPAYYADLYRKHHLKGAHVIKLGPGNDQAAREALQAWPDALQLGGGITDANALEWIDAGASQVIVTSYLFPNCTFDEERLRILAEKVEKKRLIVDVSCRRRDNKWIVAMNRWRDLADMEVNEESLSLLSQYSSEFLVHAADVEGLCQGIDEQLVEKLGQWCNIPTTYAGGARDMKDLELVDRLSNGRVDLTFGSALDIFGGSQVKFKDLVEFNRRTR
ncbi:1-(5-phosphoribosyl)-5-[(5-phosphoribosylamino)methylideneamino] imidazole-4-carboxamide isomerase [Microbotryum lychnidis-dioicae p1A1 Lamole]|uniref:1-(5-phosphoribosyl)-5-[(5-phosphoribosylamino)methylideneamino] imidazole-4-carboxamide isomerase n=1 Tax=Microbotryum lychnidis-dioicae (strain p1A1 Lamole / MvSl-1064) TaxID=683840 RepID=U5HCD7_USTV1|nr:1-(5-phosphoribosyl)-5-[(5-phosphoribosylamino)methylideneamino] imidazole-4-carboxamide isomerase [Microbotryum lychnidis-dioicae p1A1 Lamole]|eukprot:KDE04765.1 1-(5-phosphoribosyl)-5-[(5-phosphoribosylamino)methylideneamino] imidazole-4-carboxamide isomerase [Microbotryum lychnidis-dioicae p1A1 Lamole]